MMDIKNRQSKSLWSRKNQVRFTGEYFGGLIAGFGIGCAIAVYFVDKRIGVEWIHPVEMMVIGIMLINIGFFVALKSQQKSDTE